MNVNREQFPPKYHYVRVENLTKYQCEAPCFCNYPAERTSYDLIQFSQFNPSSKIPTSENGAVFAQVLNREDYRQK